MSEVQLESTQLRAQYAAQVTADLERNAKEQERIGAEVALEEQLRALRRDQALLVSMQQALGGESTAAVARPPAGEAASVPTPRRTPAEPKPAGRKKALVAKPKAKKAAVGKPDSKTAASQPSLVALLRDHLGGQGEPRSAAEIATALGRAHPDRTIKTTVVRTTVEGLVAKGLAKRTKQESSVFYTATAGQSEPAPQPAQKEKATP
ncbi:hypothetical protein ACH47C_31305 [Streptomyces rishiriensis]|uniref:hypothetical protein n=1 Tax=Streptomyces rishiriensis TaxID=68264 RepID=UPI0033F05E21